MKFTIYGKLPGLNEMTLANRGNRYAGASQKKNQTKRCALEIIRQCPGKYETPVEIRFSWIEDSYRRDPDNVTAGQKFVLDALVECGKITNDTRRYIKGIFHHFPDPEPKNPRVEVEVIPLLNK